MCLHTGACENTFGVGLFSLKCRGRKKVKVNINVEYKHLAEEKQGFNCGHRYLLTLNDALSRPVFSCQPQAQLSQLHTQKRLSLGRKRKRSSLQKSLGQECMSPSITTRHKMISKIRSDPWCKN